MSTLGPGSEAAGAQLRRWINQWDVAEPRMARWRRLTPPRLFVGSFAALILVGTLVLRLAPGLYTGPALGWVDALFMATSAVCVTGLVVVDVGTFFTPAGQGVLLLLIQAGGIGMVSFTSLIILSLGRRLSVRRESLAGRLADLSDEIDVHRLLRDVVRFTVLFELIGAVVLYALWAPTMGKVAAIWPAIFHSVSAFCNAGFSTFADSLMGYATSPGTLGIVMLLIVAGGIGFLTMTELRLRWRTRHTSRRPLSLHSRVVLGTTVLLLAAGWAGYVVLEWNVALDGLPAWARGVNALFMSVSARTAGFNTVDYADATEGGSFVTILLMSIGGAPGSMAGGLKVTTFALIGLIAWSRYRGSPVTSIADRTIRPETSQGAVGLFVFAFGLVTLAILALTITEVGRVSVSTSGGVFLQHMFEAVSAFNTVGLSMGITSDLSTGGRWVTILLMFVGRVGPLSFAAALVLPTEARGERFRYAHEDVAIG
jgi:trk system potassium uptake protein